MKKLLSLLLVLSLVLSLFVGCAKEDEAKEETKTETKEEMKEETTEEAKEETEEKEEMTSFSVGLVTDVGGIDDKSFNQSTWEGIERFAVDNAGVETTAVQSDSDADYIPNLSTLAEDELDLIVAAGFLFGDSMSQVASDFPDQQFLLIDMVVDNANVANAVFAEHHGSFLVGVAAAMKAQEDGQNKLGFVGGVSGALIGKFQAGFEAGVAAIDPEMEVVVEYAESFVDVQIGQSLATKMYDDGVYIIYQAAGNVGNGVIAEAKNRVGNGETVWVVGVDRDQYPEGIYEGDKSVILTSMMKRVDNAAYDVAQKTLAGEPQGGSILVYDLTNGGVDIPAENPNLSDAIVTAVNDYKEKVKSGEIEVPDTPAE
jgi:basic membrane protein A